MTFTVCHGLLMARFEIDGLPNLKMVDLSMAMLNNQRVCNLYVRHVALNMVCSYACSDNSFHSKDHHAQFTPTLQVVSTHMYPDWNDL